MNNLDILSMYKLHDEAIDFLNEGLANYREGIDGNNRHFKFAILHISTFSELLLKCFIAKIHPLFIYPEIFNEKINRNNTISFNQAINVIKHIYEKEIEKNHPDFISRLNRLRKIRNQIAHSFIIPEDAEKSADILGGIIESIYFLYSKVFKNKEMSNKIFNDNKEIFNELVDSFKVKLNMAKEDVAEFLRKSDHEENQLFECPACNYEIECKTLIPSDDRKYYICTFCKHKENVVSCSVGIRCGCMDFPEYLMSSWNEEEGSCICNFCKDEIEYRGSKE